jgi:Coenzyme PQQ synthesis protein D (PqqD)
MNHRMTAPTDRVDVRNGVSAREFDGEWIVLDLNGGNYFGLDDIGGIIWQNILIGHSPQEIVTRLAPYYDVSEGTLLRDVLGLMDEFIEQGLVEIRAK